MIPVPPDLTYLPYQEDGIAFSRDRKAVLIADEMGLGKTIQAIGVMNCHPEWDNVLVVCPASLKINWSREIDKWLISPCTNVRIINYDMLHRLDMDIVWDAVIFDEMQYCKNKTARRSRYCRSIKAYYKIGLTGTPILNKPIELWHPLHILQPEVWPRSSYMRYALRYCGAYRGRWGWDVSGATHLDELREILSGVMIRRLKSEVLKDLPPKRRQIIELPRTGISEDLSSRLTQAAVDVYILEGRYRDDVRQLDAKLSVVWTGMAALRHEVGLAKVDIALPLLHDAIESSGKVVVFAHHRDVIERLKESLIDYMPVVVHGGTTERARQDAVDRFQSDPKVGVFIGQIQAAGVGITLTAASHVVFLELDWTPGVMSQAEDRCHRIGQRDSVLVQHLVLEDSLDARMAKTLLRKQAIIEKTLNRRVKTSDGQIFSCRGHAKEHEEKLEFKQWCEDNICIGGEWNSDMVVSAILEFWDVKRKKV